MSAYFHRTGLKMALASSFCIWLLALAAVSAGPPPDDGAEPTAAVDALARNSPQVQLPARGPEYIGLDACLSCHDPEGASYGITPHYRVDDPRTPAAANNCETCHGPGRKHSEADDPATVPMPRNFGKISADETNTLCTTCHNRGDHVLWDGSQHESRGLACTSCHSQHASKSEAKLLKGATEMATCATCHREKIAKLDRSGHMPVREGKMECSTCHNPHGATNERLLRVGDSIAEMCTSCHAEKRGPYLWEHAPARDGCVACHDPHGSSNERMLVARPPILCQRCHVARQHPSTIYDAALVQTNLHVYARSCVMCHTNIHGSNHPSGQRFIR
jgi:DmsE family decaheme c-type cytochrome